MAAPANNTNRLRHGGDSCRHDIVLATLGPRFKAQGHYVKRLRKTLRQPLEAARGKLSALETSEVNLACRYELSALVAQKLIKDNPEAPPDQVAGWLKLVCWASLERHRCIGRLAVTGPASPPDQDAPARDLFMEIGNERGEQ